MITLDGRDHGILIKYEGKFAKSTQFGNLIRFKSVELAKSYMYNFKGVTNPRAYKLYMSLFRDIEIDFSEISKVKYNGETMFSAFVGDTVYFIKEGSSEVTTSIGYLVTENGDCEFTQDEKLGRSKLYNLLDIVQDTSLLIASYGEIFHGIESVKRSREGIEISLIGCTGKIHIVQNMKVIEMNKHRKEEQKRCLPFTKGMDRYTTLYVYCTKDKSEPEGFNIEAANDECLNVITRMISEDYKELNPRIIEVKTGKIFL